MSADKLLVKKASFGSNEDYLLSSESEDTDDVVTKNGNEADAESRSSQEDSRHVKTEAHTPEVERFVTLRKQPSDSGPDIEAQAEQQAVKKRNDSKGQPRSPKKEIVPKMNQARNTKFHKLFKELSPDEICIKGYSCAFLGDILIQGYLYISPNWFCFHSKILGIEKQIKIPVDKVLNITRERTAIFIPNAIGVVTSEDKYVFGSLLARDNTYRIMDTVWKTLGQQEGPNPVLAVVEMSIDDAENGETNNNISKETGSMDSSESECSICIHCGIPMAEHSGNENCCGEDDVVDTSYDVTAPPTPYNTQASTAASTPLTQKPKSVTDVTSTTNKQPSSLNSQQTHKPSVMSGLLNTALQSPKTHLMLSLCLVMVFLLAISAVIMLYKILLLQDRLETGAAAASPINGQGMYANMYYLNQEYHMSSIKRFHSVLEANIQVLEQIFHSLKGLEDSINVPGRECVQESSENIAPNLHTTLNDKT